MGQVILMLATMCVLPMTASAEENQSWTISESTKGRHQWCSRARQIARNKAQNIISFRKMVCLNGGGDYTSNFENFGSCWEDDGRGQNAVVSVDTQCLIE